MYEEKYEKFFILILLVVMIWFGPTLRLHSLPGRQDSPPYKCLLPVDAISTT
jgi:hypothetical protein